ncbi:hypothetical protein ACTOVL_05245 [Arcanobacterium canis]
MTTYQASTGEIFTDDDIARWANDAENGFPGYEFETVQGRPWEARTEPMITKGIRVPASLWAKLEREAQAKGMTTSALAREKLRA